MEIKKFGNQKLPQIKSFQKVHSFQRFFFAEYYSSPKAYFREKHFTIFLKYVAFQVQIVISNYYFQTST